jgi:RNA polymerase sigma factor (sigma-70 family)
MKKYYKRYYKEFYEDLYSYGLQALYEADALYDPTRTTQQFKYFATCLIRRAMFGFVRDKISKTYQHTTYTDNSVVLDLLEPTHVSMTQNLDLYRALNTLSQDERELLYLIYNEEYSQHEVSKMKNVHPHTIMRHHAKIINKLKEMLKVYEL